VTADAQTPALPAAGSSFYLGMRVLPRPRREAMFAVYAFCRAVDDVADAAGPRAERLAALAAWRSDLDALYVGRDGGRAAFLAEAVRAFALARADFEAVIDGMAMDVEEDIRAPSRATFDVYCDRVACAVGRLSVRVFGIAEPQGAKLADRLGRALQITNILRDLDEDAAIGRLYLPREALEAAGVAAREPAAALAHPALGRACAPLAAEARGHFAAADAIMAELPRRATRAPRLMAAVYRDLLARIAARGFAPPRERVRVSKRVALLALLRHGIL
jgi:phytoene synthase